MCSHQRYNNVATSLALQHTGTQKMLLKQKKVQHTVWFWKTIAMECDSFSHLGENTYGEQSAL